MTTQDRDGAGDAAAALREGREAHRRGDFVAAAAADGRACDADPGLAEAWHLLGLATAQRGDRARGVGLVERAIALAPDIAVFHHNLAKMLSELGRPLEAEARAARATELAPGYADAHFTRAVILNALGRIDAAVDSFRAAAAADPGHADTQYNLGALLENRRDLPAAVAHYARVAELDPGRAYLPGRLLHARMLMCDWSQLEPLGARIAEGLAAGERIVTPFGYQGVCMSEELLQRCARIYAADVFPSGVASPPVAPRGEGPIRVGYVCGEFREQATSILMTQVWETHDRERFEIHAFDSGRADESPRRRRIEDAFAGRMLSIARLSDAAAAQAIRARGIDILVNLNGYFGSVRQGVFALRPSPVQVNFLGFPGTLGAPYMDYIVADPVVLPPASARWYDEAVVRLPDSYQPTDATRAIAPGQVGRADCGLPERGVVFCCFNNNYKILPEIFAVWMRLLRAVPGSVLWLIEDNPHVAANLRREAVLRGVAPERLVFARRLRQPEHLARHRCADLFLDTLPYNAHTTASDALWAGLPLLTCRGTTFPGRVAASLLRSVGLPELVAEDLRDYEARALALARDPARLAALALHLRTRGRQSALFDTQTYVRHLETAFAAMHARRRAGLAPAAIDVGRPST
jgi:predicted O-linked N-acetylglucosamine transferase (SPINDLY family)